MAQGMKVGNGAILNTREMKATKIKTNKKVLYSKNNQHVVLSDGQIAALVVDGDGALQFATYSRFN